MLNYEWGNPSSVLLSGDEDPTQDSDQSPQILDQYNRAFNKTLDNSSGFNAPDHHHEHPYFLQPQGSQTESQSPFNTLDDSRTYIGSYPPPPATLSFEPVGSTNSDSSAFMLVPKSEPVGVDFSISRIGLNLGGRTYFSSSEDNLVNLLYRRSRPVDSYSLNTPRCRAEGCNADLSNAKHYHRRHKVCEFHSKAATVVAAGLIQRFCQQCSRFHLLSEFDNGKRSCRKRLADHNQRRRKSHHPNQERNNKSQAENTRASSLEKLPRSPSDSSAHSVAISPPRTSWDYFRQISFQASTSTSSPSTTSSLFFSNG